MTTNTTSRGACASGPQGYGKKNPVLPIERILHRFYP